MNIYLHLDTMALKNVVSLVIEPCLYLVTLVLSHVKLLMSLIDKSILIWHISKTISRAIIHSLMTMQRFAQGNRRNQPQLCARTYLLGKKKHQINKTINQILVKQDLNNKFVETPRQKFSTFVTLKLIIKGETIYFQMTKITLCFCLIFHFIFLPPHITCQNTRSIHNGF